MSSDEPFNSPRQGDQSFSRRILLKSSVTAIGGAVAILGMGSPAEARMSQKAAGYQLTPKGGQSCANCTIFKPPSACTLVDGVIVAAGWCRFYDKKSS
jgi:High potential iron-sulfur protein